MRWQRPLDVLPYLAAFLPARRVPWSRPQVHRCHAYIDRAGLGIESLAPPFRWNSHVCETLLPHGFQPSERTMSRGLPSMTALLGLLALAGYQNRDKLAELLKSTGGGQR